MAERKANIHRGDAEALRKTKIKVKTGER